MSATRDKTQKIAFVYSNLYKIYRDGKDAAPGAPAPAPSDAPGAPAPVPGPVHGKVIKAGDLNDPAFAALKVRDFVPVPVKAPLRLPKTIEKPEVLKKDPAPATVEEDLKGSRAPVDAIESLKDNLKTLTDLHSRLQFMLKELEDLVKED